MPFYIEMDGWFLDGEPTSPPTGYKVDDYLAGRSVAKNWRGPYHTRKEAEEAVAALRSNGPGLRPHFSIDTKT